MPKIDIIIPAGQDHDHGSEDHHYDDKLIEGYKPLVRLRGVPLLQRVLDELLECDKSDFAEDLGLRGCIDSITIVGIKDLIDGKINYRHPRTKALDQGSNLVENIRKAFYSLFEDNVPLPDIKRAFRYVTGREPELYDLEQFIEHPQGNDARAKAEVLAAIAGSMFYSRDNVIREGAFHKLIREKESDLKTRKIIPNDSSLTPDIYNFLSHFVQLDSWMSFQDKEILQYFAEFNSRLEREVTIVTCDTPILNPGFLVFLKQCEAVKSDFKKGVTTEEHLAPYYMPRGEKPIRSAVAYKMRYRSDFSGIARPYMQMEQLTRLLNLTQVKLNKLGNVANIEKAFEMRKQRRYWNMASMLYQIPFEAKRFGCYLVAAYILNSNDLQDSYAFRDFYQRVRREELTFSKIEAIVTDIIGAESRMIVSPYGVISLDVDHKRDLESFETYYLKWKDMQKDVDPSIALPELKMRKGHD